MKEILTNPNLLLSISFCFLILIIFISIIGYQVFRPYANTHKVAKGRPQSFPYLLTQLSVIIILVLIHIVIFILSKSGLLDPCNTSTLFTLTITLAFGTLTAIGLNKQGEQPPKPNSLKVPNSSK